MHTAVTQKAGKDDMTAPPPNTQSQSAVVTSPRKSPQVNRHKKGQSPVVAISAEGVRVIVCECVCVCVCARVTD